jgi:transposase-like protein
MYYEGMSLNAISRQLQQDNGTTIPDKTVFEWVNKFTAKAIQETDKIHPKVGDTWIADETYVRIDKHKKDTTGQVENPYDKSRKAKWVIFWDVIDADTRFLLASIVTTTRGRKDAQVLMEKAAERAGKVPKVVVTDSLNSYLDGIELAYGADSTHKRGSPFDIENNTNLIERFHGTLKARTKVMRALKNKDSCERFTQGWLFHYNFIRPHMSLGDKTPASVAGIELPYSNWNEFIRYNDRPIVKVLRLPTQNKPILHFRNPKPISPRKPRVTHHSRQASPKGVYLTNVSGTVAFSRRPLKGRRSRRIA